VKKLTQLKNRKAAIVKAMRAISDKATNEERVLSENEQAAYDQHKTELAQVDDRIAREEELVAFERDSIIQAADDGADDLAPPPIPPTSVESRAKQWPTAPKASPARFRRRASPR